jgi:hypothetical protein
MFKYEIKYGIICGAGISLWIFLEFLLGFHTIRMGIGEYSTYFAVIVPLITTYLGIKEKRDKQYNGTLTLSNGIKTGILISLIAAVIAALFITFYFNYINPGFFEHGIAFHTEKLLVKGKTEKDIQHQLKNIRAAYSFINQLLFGIIGTLVTGLIISIGFSLILRRNKPSS